MGRGKENQPGSSHWSSSAKADDASSTSSGAPKSKAEKLKDMIRAGFPDDPHNPLPGLPNVSA